MNRLIRSSAPGLVATLALSVTARAADKDIVDTAVAAGSSRPWPPRSRPPAWSTR